MEWTRSGEDLFVRIDPDEEIHASLQSLADEVGFDAAAITSGIGRTRDNKYGYMNEEGVYQRRPLKKESPSHTFTVAGRMMTTMFTLGTCSRRRFTLSQKSIFESSRMRS